MIKRLLKILIVIVGFGIFSIAFAVRFDWVVGQAVVVDDGVISDTTEQSRFDSVFGSPAMVYDSTTGASASDVELFHYRFRNDNGGEAVATAAASEDTAPSNIIKGDIKRLRLLLSNKGSASATNFQYRLEVSSSTCTSWLPVLKQGNTSNGEHFQVVPSSFYSDRSASSNVSDILTDPGGNKTFVAGYLMGPSTTTDAHTLTTTQFTELEFAVQPTSFAVESIAYCFRVTNAGVATNFTYTVTPTVTLVSSSVRGGGSNTETSGSGSTQTGGGANGGTGTEGGGGGAPQTGGGSGGGSGLEAFLSKKIFLASLSEAVGLFHTTLSRFLSLISLS